MNPESSTKHRSWGRGQVGERGVGGGEPGQGDSDGDRELHMVIKRYFSTCTVLV
jgi:hypothetical protein